MPDTEVTLHPGPALSTEVEVLLEDLAARELPAHELQAEAVRRLGDMLAAGREAIAADFATHPRSGRETVRALAALTDAIVTGAHAVTTRLIHPLTNPTAGERIAVLAVGGYGRGEMAPHSDVDLLFLTPWKLTAWAESVVETMLYMLWDLKLKVGHATRSLDECLRFARRDYTIRTALLEHRHLQGDAALTAELERRLQEELFHGTGAEYVEAKLEERSERHRRQGGQRYVLEPNVKEGKGGLRDLQSLYWIGKYVHGVRRAEELVERGVFTREEYQEFADAEDYLWAVRCHLHQITGRANDQLTFDMQVEVAERMGYEDASGRRAVEVFMQDYFRHATRVGELTGIFLAALEAQHLKRRATLWNGLWRRYRRRPRKGFRLVNGRLAFADEEAALARPVEFIRIFEEAVRTGRRMHPDAMRLIRRNLHLIDDRIRREPDANRIFLSLLLDHANPDRALRAMNELGVLAAFIPEFAHVVALMQFNMYHHYTVDEHTIQCISQLAQIERGELVEELPIASSILDRGVDRKVLYLAVLLHDIGKGLAEDHSVAGARIARRVAQRFGLSEEQVDLVVWLVRHHLLMSDMAQKRDISDPRTVRRFATLVKSQERLDLLTVLTVADIRGVGPGVWNNWKAVLLRQLYNDTAEALASGLEAITREKREADAKAALRAALAEWPEEEIAAELERHYPPYWQGLPTETHAVFARLLRGIREDEMRMDLAAAPERDATRAAFAMTDHPGLFSRIAGALALAGANVVDARTYTSRDGYATAVFWIQDARGHPYEESRLPQLRRTIERILKGEIIAREAFADRDRMRRREREFTVPTTITFDNEGSELFTIIEVDTRDRPGLLHDLARTLAANNVQIASAVIATYGAQAVDSFYVKDAFGLKIHSASRQRRLTERLREAIEAGARRARAAR